MPWARWIGRALPWAALGLAGLLFWQSTARARADRRREAIDLSATARQAAGQFAAALRETDVRLAQLAPLAVANPTACPALLAAAGAVLLDADGRIPCGQPPWPNPSRAELGGTPAQNAVHAAHAARARGGGGDGALIAAPAALLLVRAMPAGSGAPRAIAQPVALTAPPQGHTLRLLDLATGLQLAQAGPGRPDPPARLWRVADARAAAMPGLAIARIAGRPTLVLALEAPAHAPEPAMPLAVLALLALAVSLGHAQRRRPAPLTGAPAPAAEPDRSDRDAFALWDRHASTIIVWLDPGLALRRVSAAGAAMLGSPQSATAFGLDVAPEDAATLHALAAAARGGARPAPVRLRVRRQDGGLAWLDLTAAPDGAGGVVFALNDCSALQIVTAQLAAARREIATLALEDPLTGLANRKRLDAALRAEHRRAQRDSQPLCLLVLHPGHFAAYRERHGHMPGEACLRRIGQTLAAALQRPGDLAAHGEAAEFLVLLPNTHAVGAAIVAQRLRRAVRALLIPHALAPAGIVTLDIGLAWITPGGTPEALLATARSAIRPDDRPPEPDQSATSGASDLIRSNTRLRTEGSVIR